MLLAPMAGVTDLPFRHLCRRLGAGLTTSEMVSSDSKLWKSDKTLKRLDHYAEDAPRSVQILGANPAMMADAAKACVDLGAQIVDINMGCPAKKVCNVAAGSALLKDEQHVARILEAVVNAVSVPVTLKIRTGWDTHERNGVSVAKIAELAGIQALTVHGRTRACAFTGEVEYQTIADIKATVSIPVIANGDITSPEKAEYVLETTGADAVMVGRAAQGRPWIFREINHYLQHGHRLPEPPIQEISDLLSEHLERLYEFYGEYLGVRIARKHIGWYCKSREGSELFWKRINKVEASTEQLKMVQDYFHLLTLEPEG